MQYSKDIQAGSALIIMIKVVSRAAGCYGARKWAVTIVLDDHHDNTGQANEY